MDRPIIVVDTREQRPYTFRGADTESGTLVTGDYSLAGYQDAVAVERKSKADAYGCVGTGRKRFTACLKRLSQLHRAAVVIEADLADFCEPPNYTKINPASAVGSYISWCAQFGVPILWCGSRKYAERVTYRFLMAYWKYHVKGGKV